MTTATRQATINTFTKRARNAGAPLVGIATADQFAAAEALNATIGSSAFVRWDRVRGIRPINAAGDTWCKRAFTPTNPIAATVDLVTAIDALDGPVPFPAQGAIVIFNAHRFMSDPAEVQAFANVRESFKTNGRTVIMLAPEFKLPVELAGDVVLFREPLPDSATVRELVAQQYANAELPAPTSEALAAAEDALIGLNAFAVEQVAAMSLTKDGIDITEAWARKRETIAQTRGLSVWTGGESFDNVAGNGAVIALLRRLFANPDARPRCIVWIDEIEKSFAGARGDMSGVSQDALGVVLSNMQDTKARGMVLVGCPGSGKSLIAKAAGATFNVPVIRFDMGAMTGSLVGESQAYIRAALSVVDAIGQGRVLWLATSNDISALPPELVGRFTLGTMFFDLPTAAERADVWTLKCREYGVDVNQARPYDEGMVGRDIESVVRYAADLRVSLTDAAINVIPFGQAHTDTVERLRNQADGHWLSAATPGIYRRTATPPAAVQAADAAPVKPASRRVKFDA